MKLQDIIFPNEFQRLARENGGEKSKTLHSDAELAYIG